MFVILDLAYLESAFGGGKVSEFDFYAFMSAHPWPFVAAFVAAMLWMLTELWRFVSSE